MSNGFSKEVAQAAGPKEYQSPYAPLIDELYREEVLDARGMSAEEKFLAGESLFNSACQITLAGIRDQNPNFSEEDCRHELKRRLALREWMDWHNDDG